jgi:hypothetical protein
LRKQATGGAEKQQKVNHSHYISEQSKSATACLPG